MKKIVCLFLLILFCCSDIDASGVIFHSERNDKKIALTFDDGPHPTLTTKILDILDSYHVKATFFVVGENVDLYPDLVRREYSAGHEIGNHTYYHKNLSKLCEYEIMTEIEQTDQVLYETLEMKPKLLRPPEGSASQCLIRLADSSDHSVICWSIDTRDWAHTPVDKIYDNIKDNIKSGDIILFHDYIGYDSPTPEALNIVIPYLIDQGYTFVTVSELLNTKEKSTPD